MNLTDVIAELRRLNEPVPESLSLPTYKDVEAAESDGIGQRLAERQPSSRKNSAACHHASVDAPQEDLQDSCVYPTGDSIWPRIRSEIMQGTLDLMSDDRG